MKVLDEGGKWGNCLIESEKLRSKCALDEGDTLRLQCQIWIELETMHYSGGDSHKNTSFPLAVAKSTALWATTKVL